MLENTMALNNVTGTLQDPSKQRSDVLWMTSRNIRWIRVDFAWERKEVCELRLEVHIIKHSDRYANHRPTVGVNQPSCSVYHRIATGRHLERLAQRTMIQSPEDNSRALASDEECTNVCEYSERYQQ